MKDNPEINVKLISLVEENSCLYDYCHKDYSNRNIQDLAWEHIAKTLSEKVDAVKERWKNIRGCYTRYLKKQVPSGSGRKNVKPYYLSEYLHFLEPFTKSRTQTGNFPKPKKLLHQSSSDILSESENECENDDTVIETSILIETPSHITSPEILSPEPIVEPYNSSTNTTTAKKSFKRSKDVSLGDVNKVAYEYFSNKKKFISTDNLDIEDPDLNFLKSVLPDMKLMTDSQKRFFKISILQLTSEILQPQPLPTVQHTRQSTFQQDQNQMNIYQEPISKPENHSIIQLLSTSKHDHLSNSNTINTMNTPSPYIPQTNQTLNNNQNFHKQDNSTISTDSLTNWYQN